MTGRITPAESARRVEQILAEQLPERFWSRYDIGTHTAPTARELEVFLALVELADAAAAARFVGIAIRTVHRHVANLYARIGARDRSHAAWLLWPMLHDRYVLPGDRRRQTSAA